MLMVPGLLADALVLLHFAFVIFVAMGGLLVVKWPKTAYLHLPAALWGAVIELTGWICPLTPLENGLRRSGGESGYTGPFIEHYILPVLYPSELTRELQIAIGVSILLVNGLFYTLLMMRNRRHLR
ncbi:MAG: DUF2784 domain-containing protein [Pseudomonadota bacterium]